MKMLNYTVRKNKEREKKEKKTPNQMLKYHTTVDMINLKMPVPFISSYWVSKAQVIIKCRFIPIQGVLYIGINKKNSWCFVHF